MVVQVEVGMVVRKLVVVGMVVMWEEVDKIEMMEMLQDMVHEVLGRVGLEAHNLQVMMMVLLKVKLK